MRITSSRPLWATQGVPAHSEPHSETCLGLRGTEEREGQGVAGDRGQRKKSEINQVCLFFLKMEDNKNASLLVGLNQQNRKIQEVESSGREQDLEPKT